MFICCYKRKIHGCIHTQQSRKSARDQRIKTYGATRCLKLYLLFKFYLLESACFKCLLTLFAVSTIMAKTVTFDCFPKVLSASSQCK